MVKLIGVEAEFNITVDEELAKGIGQGVKSGAISINEIVKDAKPTIVEAVKKALDKATE